MSRVFDGTSANYLSGSMTLGMSAGGSVLAWVKQATGTDINGTIFQYSNTASTNFSGAAPASVFKAQGNQQYGASITSTTAVVDAVWTPVLFHFDGGRPTIDMIGESTATGGYYGAIATESAPELYVGIDGSTTFAAEGKIAQVAVWSAKLSAPDIASVLGGADPSTISVGTLTSHWPMDGASLTDTVGSKVLLETGTVSSDPSDNPLTASGPVITGPAGLVDGVEDTIDGTGFDTATVDLSLTGGNTVVQAVSGQTATAITITPANVLIEPTAGVPQAAVPYTVTDVAAAGTTAYTLDVDVTNTDLSTDSNPITLASSASEQTVQAMVATSVTTAGSVFDSNMIAVEDDMQVTAPLTVAPATYFTIAADGTYTHDADTTIVIPLKFYSPLTKQLSYAELTLESIALDQSTILTSVMSPILSTPLNK